jgi:hypothetical protein
MRIGATLLMILRGVRRFEELSMAISHTIGADAVSSQKGSEES